MKPTPRRTPLDLPREALHQKRYTAILCGDGKILPIEERLGKRLLRTIESGTLEGRDLLRRGWVFLRTADGKCLEGTPLQHVYACLREEAESRLAERPDDPRWQRHWLTQITSIRTWEIDLLGDAGSRSSH